MMHIYSVILISVNEKKNSFLIFHFLKVSQYIFFTLLFFFQASNGCIQYMTLKNS